MVFISFASNLKEAIINACMEFDDELVHALVQCDDYSGSTAVFALYDGRINSLVIGNVGDSKCIICNDGIAKELSKEHRPSQEEEKARIQNMGGIIHNNRVNGVLAVSRSFGDIEYKGVLPIENEGDHSKEEDILESKGSVEMKVNKSNRVLVAEPDLVIESVNSNTEFALLASDGLWDVLDSQQVVNFVRRSLQLHGDLERAVKDLTQEALLLGSVDNISVIIIAFNQKVKSMKK